jgi:hypothetical protein
VAEKSREKSLIPRKFRIGQFVQTKSGLKGRVIGSAIYGYPYSPWVEYRLKIQGRTKTLYRRESELAKQRRK